VTLYFFYHPAPCAELVSALSQDFIKKRRRCRTHAEKNPTQWFGMTWGGFPLICHPELVSGSPLMRGGDAETCFAGSA